MSRYRFIEAEKHQHAVSLLCSVLEVSRAAYYRWKTSPLLHRAAANLVLVEKIRKAHTLSGGHYGSPRIYAELQDQGVRVSRGRIARLMAASGIIGTRGRRRVRTTIPAKKPAPFADLVRRRFKAASPNELWCGDLTYVHTGEGFLYLATVIDVFSRRVIGWAIAAHMRAELVCDALRMALANRRGQVAGWSFIPIAWPSMEPAPFRTWRARPACASPWGAWLIALITPSRSRSLPRLSASFSTRGPGRQSKRREARSSIGSRPCTTGGVGTAPWECWLRLPMSTNTKYCAMRHNEAVYQIGATPVLWSMALYLLFSATCGVMRRVRASRTKVRVL